MTALTTDQASALDRFLRLKVGAVLMEQGSGKTRVAIELANQSPVDFVLWLGPCSTLDEVQAEFTKWGLTRAVKAVGWETISQSDRQYLALLAWLDFLRGQGNRIMVIADESHKVKNLEAKRYDRATRLRGKADLALLLTATEVTRDLWDLKRQMDWLSPRILNMGDGEFRAKYFTRVEYKKRGQDRKEFWKLYEPNVAHLMSLIEPYVYRADLRLEVGERTESHWYTPSDGVRDQYAPLKQKALRVLESGFGDFPAILTKLNHIASMEPSLIDGVAASAQGRCVVFCAFIDQLKALEAATASPYVIHGDVKRAERAGILDAWRQDERPLLMTLGTGAHGLNLQDAAVVHFASLTFDWAHRDHARKRVRRLGQERDMEFHYHFTDLGISRLIWENLEKKQWLSEMVKGKVEVRL